MNPRLKQIIKNKLSEDLSSVSIINYNGSIWFIDSKSKYWYLELYKKTKTLWWRLDFFEDFFILFGMEQREFVPIIIEWVEEVLNGKVASTQGSSPCPPHMVEEILNGKITSTKIGDYSTTFEMKEVLDGKILSTVGNLPPSQVMVEKVLKGEVISTYRQKRRQETQVEEILNTKAFSHDFVQEAIVQELFRNMIETTTPDSNSDYSRVEDALNSI